MFGGNPPGLVHEIIDSATASWNRERVEQIFLPVDRKLILGIPLSTRASEDRWEWAHDKKGVFTVKSAYQMFVRTKLRREDWLEERPAQSNEVGEANFWKELWGCKVPGKICHFMWRLAKQSIPMEDVRLRRKMVVSENCQVCGARYSWRHSLLECNLARAVCVGIMP